MLGVVILSEHVHLQYGCYYIMDAIVCGLWLGTCARVRVS
jgi:hypothetical protein